MKRIILLLFVALTAFAQIPRVTNFGEVERGTIYRGAQPTGSGLLDLAASGFKTVLDLRDDVTVAREQIVVESLGMRFINIPMKGLSAPTDAQIQQAMTTLANAPKPIFLHCKHGQDRTGIVVACWRISHNGAPNAVALQEAKFFGISIVQFGMKHYILTFNPTKVLISK